MAQPGVERAWQETWNEQKAFEPDPDNRKKFLCTFPYPYVNGLPHVGHLFTMMRVEALARYKRSKGFNVLFPQGWHATGSPIVNAAGRVRDGDEKQLKILRDFGVPEGELEKFSEPEHWIEYFVPNYKEDIQRLGMSIDWRREFVTTSLNPRYDAFIRWQFRKLKEKERVQLGKHPVVWCPKESVPVSDHARIEGEGETAQEFVLVKFRLDSGETLPCATLRPETIPGVTNLWLNPDVTYARAQVDGETWIVSEEALAKLAEQEHDVSSESTIQGADLIGRSASAPGERLVPILPATFLTTKKGTGVVMSVPSDAPDDYIALRDLKRSGDEIPGVDLDAINPIPIIRAEGLGDLAAVKVVEERGITDQNQRKQLEEAKKLVYKKGFYEGVMIAGAHKDEPVETAKEATKQELLDAGDAVLFFELTGKVVCRCLTESVVKVVQNQWFITYGDPAWKDEAHAALDQMKLYPEAVRAQFDHVLDWLNDWACTRQEGLGTRLPWDEQWLIESLSDSTFYNAYYTFAHLLKELSPEDIDDALFDYVILGRGEAKDDSWEEMRQSFTYWYPVDFRNSGKDLVQNHLSFMLFTHTAILDDPSLWPQSYGVNGWVTVDGRKMSKSLGNLIPVRAMLDEYGADASRLTILNGGEGLDDPNWDSGLARTTADRLPKHVAWLVEHHGKGADDETSLDAWLSSSLHRIIYEAEQAMEETRFRNAIQLIWFELSSVLRKYVQRTTPNKALLAEAIRAQIVMLQPFAPHHAEEAWKGIGGEGLVSLAAWPKVDADRIDRAAEEAYALVERTAQDLSEVLGMVGSAERATLFVADDWKYLFIERLKEALAETPNPGEIIKRLMRTGLRSHGQQVAKMVPRYAKDRGKLPSVLLSQEEEFSALKSAAHLLSRDSGLRVSVLMETEADNPKASQAMPGKPAILLE